MNIIGLDPGVSGGIAFVGSDHADAVKMPATETDVVDVLRELRNRATPVFAYLEEVHSMPSDGVRSAFSFGQNYGGLRMALIALQIPFKTVRPQLWQRHVGIRPVKNEAYTKRKNRLKARAQELFPSLKPTLSTSDALLIARYGYETHERGA